MKTAVKILIVLFVLLIAGLIVGFLSLNRIVKKGVETVGPAIVKVEVKVKDVDLSPFSGSGKIQGLLVGNPPGFKLPSAIQAGLVSMKVEPRSLLGDKVIVRSIRVESPEITFEGGLNENNLNKILENVQGTEQKAPATKEEKKATSRKLQVDEFVLTGAKVHVNSPLLAGKTATVSIPDINLTNLGQGPEGITPAELTKRVLKEVVESTVKAVGSSIGELGKEVTSGIKDVTTNAVGGATKKIGDLFKKKQE